MSKTDGLNGHSTLPAFSWSKINLNYRTLLTIVGVLAVTVGADAYSTWTTAGDSEVADRSAITSREIMGSGSTLLDISVGAADAKITIVVYDSLSCPHCATFHKTVYPKIKKKYVDSGKVRFIFREFPLNEEALNASVVVRCVPPEKALTVITELFNRQATWAFVADSIAPLQALARPMGITDAAFRSCINDEKLKQEILKIRDKGQAFGVDKVPTFFIIGKNLLSYDDVGTFDKLLEPLMK